MPTDLAKTKEELLAELKVLRQRNAELELSPHPLPCCGQNVPSLDELEAIVYVADMESYEVLYVNKHTQEFFGENIVGRKCWQTIQVGMDGPCPFCTNNKLLDDLGRPTEGVHWEFDNTSLGRCFRLHDKAIVWDGCRLVRLTIAIDITDRKRAEETLRESEKQHRQLAERGQELEAIINHSPAIAFLWKNDERWSVEFASKNIDQFGYTPEDFYSGKVLFIDIVHPEDLARVTGEVVEYSEQGLTSFTQEYRIITRSGDVRWTDDKIWARKDAKGNITHYQGIVVDITERKQGEEELRKLTRAVEQSQASIVITDKDGAIEYVNPFFSQITGYTSEEALGQNPRVLKSDQHPDSFYREMWETLVAGHTWSEEICNKRKDGTLFWEHSTISPLKDKRGDTTHYIAVKRDITEYKKLERLREDVERIMRHDLKTPLNGIVGLPQIMMDDENLTPEQIGYLNLIQEAGYRMLKQINFSLDLYKMETGAFQYQPRPMELTGLLKRLLHDLGLKAEKKGVGLEALIKGVPWNKAEVLLFQADEALCYSMLSNLLDNAVDAMPMGERVTLRLDEEPDAVIFSVHNHGAVPETVRDTFFDKYVTHGKPGGTGLGTYSARLMAEAQGGSIRMETSPKEGTTVTVRIPRG